MHVEVPGRQVYTWVVAFHPIPSGSRHTSSYRHVRKLSDKAGAIANARSNMPQLFVTGMLVGSLGSQEDWRLTRTSCCIPTTIPYFPHDRRLVHRLVCALRPARLLASCSTCHVHEMPATPRHCKSSWRCRAHHSSRAAGEFRTRRTSDHAHSAQL